MKNDIVLYSKKNCSFCKKVKELFENERIDFTLNTDVEEMKREGVKILPTVKIGNIKYERSEILSNYMDWKPFDGRKLMSEAKFYEGYSRYLDEEERYETWEESVSRVMDMHRVFYKDRMTDELSGLFNEIEDAYKNKLFLGAQRALQFGGEQLLKNHGKIYNCFHKDTSFITSNGVKSFNDFADSDTCIVRTHTGEWKNANVKFYGNQELFKLKFKKGSNQFSEVIATRNHRWMLNNETVTSYIQLEDKLIHTPDIFCKFNWDDATSKEKLYWCYGMVYGYGTIDNRGYSKIRLCGNDSQYESRFLEMGFSSSSSLSLNGDIIIFTGKYDKKPPDPEIDSPELIRAFVSGYLHADGEENYNGNGNQFPSIQSSDVDHIEFIRKCFPIAGIYITREKDLTGEKTNFGIRGHNIRFGLHEDNISKYDIFWTLKEIIPYGLDEAWCLKVDDHQTFTLDNGIVTGNCAGSYCNRPDFFGGYFYFLLCGCGVGFSVQKQHISQLPNIHQRNKPTKTYVVPDSIEGWATSVDVLLSSYFVGGGVYPEYEGSKIHLDLSNIRPKDAFISGGFKAPGPEPLRRALDKIEFLIEQQLKIGKEKLSPIVVYDVCMYIADAVISGGM